MLDYLIKRDMPRERLASAPGQFSTDKQPSPGGRGTARNERWMRALPISFFFPIMLR